MQLAMLQVEALFCSCDSCGLCDEREVGIVTNGLDIFSTGEPTEDVFGPEVATWRRLSVLP